MKYTIIVVFILFVSCKKKEKAVVKEAPVHKSLALFNENKTFVIEDDINPQIKNELKDWDEYFELSKFLNKNFLVISPALSLELSKELTDLSKTMNDSLQIKELNTREMFARLNVFYSESLRLQDMSDISSIKAVEVTDQVSKIMSVFNSINLKINSIYLQNSFDKSVDFDESIFEFNKEAEAAYARPKKLRKPKPIQNGKPSFRK